MGVGFPTWVLVTASSGLCIPRECGVFFFGKTGFLEKVSPARGCGASPEPEQSFGIPWARGLNPPFPKFPQLCFHGRSSSRCFGAFSCAQGGARGEVTAGCDTGDWTLLHPPAHPCGAARAPRGSTNSSEFLGIVGNSCPPSPQGRAHPGAAPGTGFPWMIWEVWG